MRRIGVWAIALLAIVGFKFWNRNSDEKKFHKEMVELCEGDPECIEAVETHFDVCFSDSYSMGGRRRAAHLDVQKMVDCINQKAGKTYFSVED